MMGTVKGVGVRVREATKDEFARISEFWGAMSRELGWNPAMLPADWLARSVRYYSRRYDDGELRSFVAEADGQIVGCATGFLLDGYPRDFITRPHAGYIVGVYVEPAYRRCGAASDLTRAAIAWLRSVGCSVARLRASDTGRRVYEKLGFSASAEMELRI